MKTAIASTAKTPNGEISDRGGRAPYYLIFDDKNKLIKSIKNPFATGGGGAGYGVAKMLKDEGVDKVVVGKIGGKMEVALEEAGIEFIEGEGTIDAFIS
jgi:predicted Fe-Mo cluster-binding NifX family protein